MELINKHFVGDFLGFTYDGTHSSTLGLVRVSAGNRYQKNLFPAFTNKTVQPEGKDGFYYFGAYYTNNQMQVDTAFDNLNEEQFQKLSTAFSCKQFKELWFDETPYKAFWAKLAESPQIKYLCFTGDDGKRVYKGEMVFKFETLEPWAHNRVVTWEDNVQVIRQTGNNVENDALVIEGLMEDLIQDKDDTRYVPIIVKLKDITGILYAYYVDTRMIKDFYFYTLPITTKFNDKIIQIDTGIPSDRYHNLTESTSLNGVITYEQNFNNKYKRPLYYNYLRYNLAEDTETEALGKLYESFNFKDWMNTIPVNIENNNYGVKEGDFLIKYKISKNGTNDMLYKFKISHDNKTKQFIIKIKNKLFGNNTTLNLYIDSKKKIIYTIDTNGKKNILNIERRNGNIFTLPLGEYTIEVKKKIITELNKDDDTGWEDGSVLVYSNNLTGDYVIKPYYYFY